MVKNPLKTSNSGNLLDEAEDDVPTVTKLTRFPKPFKSKGQAKYSPPKDLSASGKKWAKRVYADYVFEEHQIELINEAARTKDRLAQNREAIKKDGPYHKDRFGNLRPHPALIEERNNKIILARLIRELNLSEEPESPRPPGIEY